MSIECDYCISDNDVEMCEQCGLHACVEHWEEAS